MKRLERSRYVPHVSNPRCENEMKYATCQYASEAANMQSLQRRSKNTVPFRMRFDSSSSSSNQKNTSDESCTDNYSNDFGECCSGVASMNNLKIRNGTNEDNSNDHWKKGCRRERPPKHNRGIQTENFETNTKISDRCLMEQKDYSDLKSHSNQNLNSESNEKNFDRDLFYNYGDSSISDIESIIDCYTKKGSVLTSTPNSDIVDKRVLNAAKYVPRDERGMESTLNDENDIQATINVMYCDGRFEIYHDPPSFKEHPEDYSEIFGNNYISPPVPPPAHTFQLPPIHRLPSPVSSSSELSVPRPVFHQLSVPRHVFSQLTVPHLVSSQQSVTRPVSSQQSVARHVFSQLTVPHYVFSKQSAPRPISSQKSPPRHVSSQPSMPRRVFLQYVPQLLDQPRHPPPPALQINPDIPRHLSNKSSYIPQISHDLSSSYVQTGSDSLPPNPPRMSFSIQPPRLHQGRVISPNTTQDTFNPPNLESYKQDGSFYIPPPIPPPWMRNPSDL